MEGYNNNSSSSSSSNNNNSSKAQGSSTSNLLTLSGLYNLLEDVSIVMEDSFGILGRPAMIVQGSPKEITVTKVSQLIIKFILRKINGKHLHVYEIQIRHGTDLLMLTHFKEQK